MNSPPSPLNCLRVATLAEHVHGLTGLIESRIVEFMPLDAYAQDRVVVFTTRSTYEMLVDMGFRLVTPWGNVVKYSPPLVVPSMPPPPPRESRMRTNADAYDWSHIVEYESNPWRQWRPLGWTRSEPRAWWDVQFGRRCMDALALVEAETADLYWARHESRPEPRRRERHEPREPRERRPRTKTRAQKRMIEASE